MVSPPGRPVGLCSLQKVKRVHPGDLWIWYGLVNKHLENLPSLEKHVVSPSSTSTSMVPLGSGASHDKGLSSWYGGSKKTNL